MKRSHNSTAIESHWYQTTVTELLLTESTVRASRTEALNDRPCWNCFKGNVSEASVRQGGWNAHMGFCEQTDTILDWTVAAKVSSRENDQEGHTLQAMHSLCSHAHSPDVQRHSLVDGRRQGEVEETITAALSQNGLVQVTEPFSFVVGPSHVLVQLEELLQLLLLPRLHLQPQRSIWHGKAVQGYQDCQQADWQTCPGPPDILRSKSSQMPRGHPVWPLSPAVWRTAGLWFCKIQQTGQFLDQGKPVPSVISSCCCPC